MNLVEHELELEQETTTLDEIADLPNSGSAICLVVLGEFSSGKSSLANLLIGSDLLPTDVLSTTRRLTRLHHADQLKVTAVDRSGQGRDIDHCLATEADVDCFKFDIGIPCKRLRALELVDTPGLSDPSHDPDDTLEVVEQSDVAIWCTRANQAWRHSEQTAWMSLPSRLRETGLLVVTGGDKLAKAADRRSLMSRLRREAGPMFHGIVLLSVPDAVHAQSMQTSELDVQLWKRSGGEAFAVELIRSLSRVVKRASTIGAGRLNLPANDEVDCGTSTPEPAVRSANTIEADSSIETEEVVSIDSTAPKTVTSSNGPAFQGHGDPENQNDIEILLTELMATIESCRLAACVDLEKSRTVALRSRTSPPSEALADHLASLAFSLFAAPEIQAVHDVRKQDEANTSQANVAIEAIAIERDRGSYILWRHNQNPSQVVVLAGAGQPSIVRCLGVVLVKVRQLSSHMGRAT